MADAPLTPRRRASRFAGLHAGEASDDRRPPSARIGILLVWLAFIVAPVVNAFGRRTGEPRHALVIAVTVGFSAIYLRLLWIWRGSERARQALALAVAVTVIAIGLTLADGRDWGFLFSYGAAAVALTLPSPRNLAAVAVVTVLAFGVGAARASAADAFGYAVSAVGVGVLVGLMRDLRDRNLELDAARAELARTAVAAERERFARDLHDLLGHSLSVIAIKAELAGRLLPGSVDRAAREVGDLEQVARTALGEVRDAVSGYRQPTLAGELEGARIALSAAGIIADFESSPVALDPDVEAVLAWAVREGATNVIRHSGARCCRVRILAADGDAGVEVIDDGAGAAEPSLDGVGAGNGLAGLRERAAGVRGRLEAEVLPAGGFRLALSVPGPDVVEGAS